MLTVKQEKFAQELFKSGNASQAYRNSYDCSRMNENSVGRRAHELTHNSKIKARLAELNAKAVGVAVMTRQEALEILTQRARVNFFDFVEFSEMVSGKDEDGNPITQTTWRVKDRAELTPQQLMAISELSAGRKGLSIKTHDPLAALAQLAKLCGWEAAQKHELTGPNGGPLLTRNVSEMTDEELAAYLQADDKQG